MLIRKRRDLGQFRANAVCDRRDARPLQRCISDVVAANHHDVKRIRVSMVRYERAVGRDLLRQIDSGPSADGGKRGCCSSDGVVRSLRGR
jgi:hypothetical protein